MAHITPSGPLILLFLNPIAPAIKQLGLKASQLPFRCTRGQVCVKIGMTAKFYPQHILDPLKPS